MSIFLSGSLASSSLKDLLYKAYKEDQILRFEGESQYLFGSLLIENINLEGAKENNIKSDYQNQNDQYFGQDSFDNLYKNNQISLMVLLFFL